MSPRPVQFRVVIVTVALLSIGRPIEAAFLEGKVMQVNLDHKTLETDAQTFVSSGHFVVGPGVELMGFGFRADDPALPALVDIDVSDTQVLITLLIDQPPAFREILTIIDPTDTIATLAKAVINSATNWAGLQSDFVQPGENAIVISLGGLAGVAGQRILLDVIPEPATGSLGLAAATVWACGVWRRLKSTEGDLPTFCRNYQLNV